tara:strand:+ start:120 stop:263 length:144 start_codon:yes stop_codon:yes gene_type:complete
MELLTEYWQVFIGFITLVVILAKMNVDVEVLKDKVKTLFELFNKKEK